MKWCSVSLSLGALICENLPAACITLVSASQPKPLLHPFCCQEGPEEPGPLAVPGPPLGVSDLETALMD